MAATNVITQARLKELLRYDINTGLFTWLVYRNHLAKAGDVAGCPDKHGYIVIRVDNVLHKAHRLAFLYVLGWMPVEVDHDDHVTDNNRWKNLNPATHAENGKNQKLPRNNTSGTCGVRWDERRGKWHAQVMINRKNIFLGYFTRKSNAIAARQAADIKYNFHENHGDLND